MWSFIGVLGGAVFTVGLIIGIIMLIVKKPLWKKTLLASLAGLILFCIGISNYTPSVPTESKQNPTKVSTQAPANTPTQKAAFNWNSSEITADTIKQALKQDTEIKPMSRDAKFPNDITNIEVIDNASSPGTKNVLIYYKRDSMLNETHFAKESGGTAIMAGSILFSNPSVGEVSFFAQVDMTNQYGKTDVENGIKIVLNRALANQADWKGLAERHLTDPGNIYRISENYTIHPGILKNIKATEVNLRK